MAETCEDAYKAFDLFETRYQAKYPKATECLVKDKEEMLAFYDFPAEHWMHICTTNPIESTFATIRLRTNKTKSYGSRKTTLAMMYKLAHVAQSRWKRLKEFALLADVINGIIFVNGIKQQEIENDQQEISV